jgi:hypothetical protein
MSVATVAVKRLKRIEKRVLSDRKISRKSLPL